MTEDPFASPETLPELEDAEAAENAEAIRAALLPREGAVRMAATPFWVVGGVLAVLGAVGLFVGGSASALGASVALLLAGGLLGALAKAVRDVRPWARAPALVVAGLLCAVGVGLAVRAGRLEPIHAGLVLLASMPLFLLSSRASAYVFSADYSAIVRATPHLQYRAPPAVWVSLVILVLAVLAMVWWTVARVRAADVQRATAHSSLEADGSRSDAQLGTATGGLRG